MSIGFWSWREAPHAGHHLWARSSSRVGALLLVALAISACSDAPTAPRAVEGGTPVRWNAIARELVVNDRSSPPMAGRAYAYLSVAQYAAGVAARGIRPGTIPSLAALRDAHSPSAAAIATASARILAAMFPSQTLRIEHELSQDLAALRGQEIPLEAVERGEAVGAAIATSLLARADGDGSDAAWDGSMPNGDGVWTGTNPEHPLWGLVKPWLWDAGSDMRAPPPPAFNSEAFLEALAEVRSIAVARTPAQLEIARFWADGAGTYTPPGHWNQIAADLITERDMNDLAAARTLALVNLAMADAFIGCWDSKFHYWVIRPWQADPLITTPIGQPPHPSYPSGHACGSGAAGAVLGALFPDRAGELERMAVEASDSRVYAGIHYSFDAEAGMAIGTSAAQRALERGDALVRAEIARAFATSND